MAKAKKRKTRRNVSRAVVHIKATFNNTLVTITDPNGDALCWASSGTVGFKGSRKSTPFAAQRAAETAAATASKFGVKEVEVYSWQGVAAPRGLPADVKTRLHGALVGALNDPKMRQKLSENGFEVVANTPEQFSQFEAQELQRWKTVIEKGRIVLD